ncbi:MAG: hypothetical protein COA43_01190 [Robiginitomaculum sp.]|nr:MAG: hypothetical protein COA43_01190 [Robiginitomaculum sp.]
MSDAYKKAKASGYSKGYVAGQKRTEKENARWMKIHDDISKAGIRTRNDAFNSAYLIALESVLSSSWKTENKTHTTVEEHTGMAAIIAASSLKHMRFK